jgi:uncharacterized protein YqeY
MGVLSNLSEEIKEAMRSKDVVRLESLRAIKSAVLLVETSGANSGTLSDEEAIKLLQRLVKQRKDSAAIFRNQQRPDLAEPEEAQAEVIASFLPEQLSKEQVEQIIIEIIDQLGAEGMKDMGKVMGMATKKLGGKAEGKLIASLVKEKLS